MNDSQSGGPSGKILSLFEEFRDNDAAIENLKSVLASRTKSYENVQKKFHKIKEILEREELDYHNLQKALVKVKEQEKNVDDQLAQLNNHQITVHIELVQADGDIKNIKKLRAKHRQTVATTLSELSTAQMESREVYVDRILKALDCCTDT